MKQVIYKYVMPSNQCSFDLPLNAEVLSVGEQQGSIVLWVKLDPDPEASKKPRYFHAINTGDPFHQISALYHFIGTVTIGGRIVWHVFEIIQYQRKFDTEQRYAMQERKLRECLGRNTTGG